MLVSVDQKLKLIDGEFTPSEAFDVLHALINEKIKFHKQQRLGLSIHDETIDTKYLSDRVKELLEEKQAINAFIKQARAEGCQVRIHGILEMSLEPQN